MSFPVSPALSSPFLGVEAPVEGAEQQLQFTNAFNVSFDLFSGGDVGQESELECYRRDTCTTAGAGSGAGPADGDVAAMRVFNLCASLMEDDLAGTPASSLTLDLQNLQRQRGRGAAEGGAGRASAKERLALSAIGASAETATASLSGPSDSSPTAPDSLSPQAIPAMAPWAAVDALTTPPSTTGASAATHSFCNSCTLLGGSERDGEDTAEHSGANSTTCHRPRRHHNHSATANGNATAGRGGKNKNFFEKITCLPEDNFNVLTPDKRVMLSIPAAYILPTNGSANYIKKNRGSPCAADEMNTNSNGNAVFTAGPVDSSSSSSVCGGRKGRRGRAGAGAGDGGDGVERRMFFSFCLCKAFSVAGGRCHHGTDCDFIHCAQDRLPHAVSADSGTIIDEILARKALRQAPPPEEGGEVSTFQVHWSAPVAALEEAPYARLPPGRSIYVKNGPRCKLWVFPSEYIYKTIGSVEATRPAAAAATATTHGAGENNSSSGGGRHHYAYPQGSARAPLRVCKHYEREKCARGPLCHFVHPVIFPAKSGGGGGYLPPAAPPGAAVPREMHEGKGSHHPHSHNQQKPHKNEQPEQQPQPQPHQREDAVEKCGGGAVGGRPHHRPPPPLSTNNSSSSSSSSSNSGSAAMAVANHVVVGSGGAHSVHFDAAAAAFLSCTAPPPAPLPALYSAALVQQPHRAITPTAPSAAAVCYPPPAAAAPDHLLSLLTCAQQQQQPPQCGIAGGTVEGLLLIPATDGTYRLVRGGGTNLY